MNLEIDKLLECLNLELTTKREIIQQLFEYRIPCKTSIENADMSSSINLNTKGELTLSIVDLINSILSKLGNSKLILSYNSEGILTHFEVIQRDTIK